MTSIDNIYRLSGQVSALAVLERFERLANVLGVEATTWRAYGSGERERPGGIPALRKYIAKRESEMEIFSLVTSKRVLAEADRQNDGSWRLTYYNFDADAAWIARGISGLRSVSSEPELIDACVHRGAYGTPDFPLTTPIAAQNYAVLVTDAQVADAYDDPLVFWKAWDSVETIDGRKLCVRALRALDYERWLGETFERTMALARAAKPGLTVFPIVQLTGLEGPWWDYGDVQDEKAGWPMLDLVGYVEDAKTIEYAAKPNHDGHVLIQELQTLKSIARRGQTRDGKPVEVVRVVFADEAQARAEKRPLLDVGVRVYYLDKAGELVELTS